MYRKLKRISNHGYVTGMKEFLDVFPELQSLSPETLSMRFDKLKYEFYQEELVPVRLRIRVTLPAALIVLVAMFLYLPIHFVVTGKWGYSLGKKNRVYNWLRSLRLQ